MSEAKYFIENGDKKVGIVWEAENGDKIFIPQETIIDFNSDLEVYDAEGNYINHVDLRELIIGLIAKE